MSIQSLMFHTVTISTSTTSKNANGGIDYSYSATYTAIPANVQPASAKQVAYYNQLGVEVTHIVYVAQVVALSPGDTIDFNSRTLWVTGWRNLIELDRVTEIAATEYKGVSKRDD